MISTSSFLLGLLLFAPVALQESEALTRIKKGSRHRQQKLQTKTKTKKQAPEFVPEDPFFDSGGDYLVDSSANPLNNYTANLKLEKKEEEEPTEPPEPEPEEVEVEATEEPDTGAASGCVTKEDDRASSWFGQTALPGTACVFGVDARDEGEHCVMETKFGSFGWCWTDENRKSWGSCGEGCPLVGHAKLLGAKIDGIRDHLADVMDVLNGTEENATNATNATEIPIVEPAPEEAEEATADGAGDASEAAAGGDAAPADPAAKEAAPAKKAPAASA